MEISGDVNTAVKEVEKLACLAFLLQNAYLSWEEIGTNFTLVLIFYFKWSCFPKLCSHLVKFHF